MPRAAKDVQPVTEVGDERPPQSLSEKELSERLALAVLRTPGVVRLEPTLKHALRRLAVGRPAGTSAATPPGASPVADGVRLTVAEGTAAAIVDVTISSGHQALATAETIQQAGLETLTAALPEPIAVSVVVNVLGIE